MRACLLARLASIGLLVVSLAPARASAQLGGAMQGGFGGAEAPEVSEPKPRAAMTPEAARTWVKLQQKVPMDFPEQVPLMDVLKHIREATSKDKGKDDPGLAIYLDPIGLKEGETTGDAPVTIQLDGLPLAATLRLVLQQVGLTYLVRKDGLVLVTSLESGSLPGILDESVPPVSAPAARIWEAISSPVSLPFPDETPLEDVLKYIKQVTTSPSLPEGIPIYVDPVGLQEAEKSETSPVRINLQGLPLSVGLKLLLDQLGLGYHVEEQGYLHISEASKARALSKPVTWERLADLEAEVERLKEENEGLQKAQGQPSGRGGGFQSRP